MWAFVMCVIAILIATASAHAEDATPSSGGVAPPGATPEPLQNDRTQLGDRTLDMGMQGEDVRVLQSILRAKRFGSPRPRVTGEFDSRTDRAVADFERQAGLRSDGVADKRTARALVKRMRKRKATWYGPGFWGQRTACGQKLRRGTVGVAHRTLPCGTRVTFSYHGRFVIAKVIDRGPFANGADWDLTQAAARRLEFASTDRLRVAYPRR
jgi:rare lipoprotein A (peptidoglycan hydrolase)